MKRLASQFRRLFNDDGRHDKMFFYQEHKLKEALAKLKHATDEVIKQSQRLQYCLSEHHPEDTRH